MTQQENVDDGAEREFRCEVYFVQRGGPDGLIKIERVRDLEALWASDEAPPGPLCTCGHGEEEHVESGAAPGRGTTSRRP